MDRRPEMLQEARGLVPDGVRVLLVEAELKLMEAKYRGVRAGERWQAHHMLIVSGLRADTHGDLMSVIEAVAAETAATNAAVAAAATASAPGDGADGAAFVEVTAVVDGATSLEVRLAAAQREAEATGNFFDLASSEDDGG
mmetsp:Transcript_17132/g.39475  ORF Transcript_17132/g.39475 Transcript_17132/m.39475 type:complete len:141 (-) Transcript_17132:188-610(-)